MLRYLALVLMAITAVIAAGCGGGGGGGAREFSVYADSVEVAQNSTFALPIRIANVPSAPPAGYQMTIRYDDSKLELLSGASSVHPGSVVPAAPNRIIAKDVGTPGQIRVAMLGWSQSENNILNLITTNTQLLTIQFRAIGSLGPTTIEIDDAADAPTPLQLWTREATRITPGPVAVDGTVTIQ